MFPLLILLLPLCADSVPQIASDAHGRVGAAAAVIEGNSVLAFHSQEHFPMQSVYKLPIGMAVLAQVDSGRLHLDQKVHVDQSEYISKGKKARFATRIRTGPTSLYRSCCVWRCSKATAPRRMCCYA